MVTMMMFMVMNDAYYNDDDDRNDGNDDSSGGGCGGHDDCMIQNKMLFCIPVLLFWHPKLGSGICFFLSATEVMMIM